MTTHLDELGEQVGRTFVVTGANSGIGFETTWALVDRGAYVVLAVRSIDSGVDAAAQLTGPGTTSVTELDLADLDQVTA
jgi:NAD(P)-dependent dehydrogenase (short-subunit alcohol dehydrogenase family)